MRKYFAGVLTVLFIMAAVIPIWHSMAVPAVSALEYRLPVLMYHGILSDDSKNLGEYVISVSEFESDLQYLLKNGYQTVGIGDVINYVKHGTDLPPKAVMITFDDGYYNNYVYAYPLLQQYSCRMVLAPICKWTDYYTEEDLSDVRYTHVKWNELLEMQNSGLVEIANHSYDLHTVGHGRQGTARKRGESTVAYQQILNADLQKAQERFTQKLGATPVAFAYPFGAVSSEASDVLRELGFEAAMTCEEKINILTHDEACLYRLGRFKRPHGVSSEAFFQKVLS